MFDRNEWLDEFISLIADWNISISLHNMDSGQSLDGLLSTFQPVSDSKWPYILLTSLNSTLQILEHAQMEYLRTRDYTWLIYRLHVDFNCLLPHLGAEDNLAILSGANDTTPYARLAASALSNAYQTVSENSNWNHDFGVTNRCKAIMDTYIKNTMMSHIREEIDSLKVCHNCSQFHCEELSDLPRWYTKTYTSS